MSRGPGRWQAAILGTLEWLDAFSVSALVRAEMRDGAEPQRSDYVAARRAVRTLAEQNKARALYCYVRTADGSRETPQLVVARLSSEVCSNAAPTSGTPSWVEEPPPGATSLGTREIAATMGVSASTVSRDMKKRSAEAH